MLLKGRCFLTHLDTLKRILHDQIKCSLCQGLKEALDLRDALYRVCQCTFAFELRLCFFVQKLDRTKGARIHAFLPLCPELQPVCVCLASQYASYRLQKNAYWPAAGGCFSPPSQCLKSFPKPSLGWILNCLGLLAHSQTQQHSVQNALNLLVVCQ